MMRTSTTLLLLALLLALVGCGSGSHVVPSVVGERLDLAESTVNDAGLEYEEIGGGAFGIVVRSNWTVCAQEPKAGEETSGKVKLIVERSC